VPDNAIIDEGQNQITYNVVIDPGDIARQAEEIRNQLDLALGVGSSSGTQFASTTDFINPQFAPLPDPDFNTTAGQFGGAVDQSFWQKAQARMEEVSQDISTGYDRIRQDLSMVAERGGNIIQRFQPEPQSMNPYENLLPDTFGEYLMGSLGFGADITGPIAPSEYKRYSNVKLGEELSSFGKENMGAIAGTVIGSIGGLPGAFTGFTIGSTVDEAVQLVTGTYQKTKDLTEGLQEIARQQYGNISKEEALGVANQIVDYTFSAEGVGKGYDLEEISQNILQFANEGGFNNVKSTEQFKEKIQAITEDLRQFGRDMGVFQEEAISILAEMEQRGIAKVENMREISSNMKFYSGVTGIGPVELLQGAAQIADQFRETLTPSAAMDMYIDAQVEATRMVRSTDPNTQSLVYRLGGKQGVTQALIGSYDNMFQGGMGQLQQLSMYYNPNTTGNPNDIINTSATNFTPGSYYDFIGGGGREATKNMSLDQMSLMWGERVVGYWNNTVGVSEGPPTMQQLKGFMIANPEAFGGITPQEVDAVIENLSQKFKDLDSGNQFQKQVNAEKQLSKLKSVMQNNETTLWGDIKNTRLNIPNAGSVSIADVERGFKYFGNTIGGAWDSVIDSIEFHMGGGLKIDYSTGEIESGALDFGKLFDYSQNLHFEGDKVAPKDPFIRKELMKGTSSNYRQKQRQWMEEQLLLSEGMSTYNQSKQKDLIGIVFGDMSGVVKDDDIYGFVMGKEDPQIDDNLERLGYFTREIKDILETEPTITRNKDGSVKTAKEISDILSSKIEDPYSLPDDIKEKVLYKSMSSIPNIDLRRVTRTGKELKYIEKNLSNDYKKYVNLAETFNDVYEKEIDAGMENAEKRLKDSLIKDLPSSMGSKEQLEKDFDNAIKLLTPETIEKEITTTGGQFGAGSTKTIKKIVKDPFENISIDQYSEELEKEFVKAIETRSGKKVTDEDRDKLRELMFDPSTVSGKFTADLEDINKEKRLIPVYNAVDNLAKLQDIRIDGTSLSSTLIKTSARMLMDKKLGSGQNFDIMDPSGKDLTEYGKQATIALAELRETITGEGPVNMVDFKDRLENLRTALNLNDADFKKFSKENFNYEINDSQDMGLNIRYSLDELKLHTTYLYSLAKVINPNIVQPGVKGDGSKLPGWMLQH